MYNKKMFIEKAKKATSLDNLNKIFETCIASMGFHKWAYQQSYNGEEPFILTNYDTQWKDHYLANNYSFINSQNQLLEYDVNLTHRQREILKWLAQGKTSKDISDILFITNRTVTFHTENIKKALNADTLAQAVAKAYKKGILSL